MSLNGIDIFSVKIKQDEEIYQYLTRCSQCEMSHLGEGICYDMGCFCLTLKKAVNNNFKAQSTGLKFISCDMEHDRHNLQKLGAWVEETSLSNCRKYITMNCRDCSGNSVTLMQYKEVSSL